MSLLSIFYFSRESNNKTAAATTTTNKASLHDSTWAQKGVYTPNSWSTWCPCSWLPPFLQHILCKTVLALCKAPLGCTVWFPTWAPFRYPRSVLHTPTPTTAFWVQVKPLPLSPRKIFSGAPGPHAFPLSQLLAVYVSSKLCVFISFIPSGSSTSSGQRLTL